MGQLCGFDISFEVVEWGAMLVALRYPPTSQQALGSDAMNISLPPSTYISQMALYFVSSNLPPKGCNIREQSRSRTAPAVGRATGRAAGGPQNPLPRWGAPGH